MATSFKNAHLQCAKTGVRIKFPVELSKRDPSDADEIIKVFDARMANMKGDKTDHYIACICGFQDADAIFISNRPDASLVAKTAVHNLAHLAIYLSTNAEPVSTYDALHNTQLARIVFYAEEKLHAGGVPCYKRVIINGKDERVLSFGFAVLNLSRLIEDKEIHDLAMELTKTYRKDGWTMETYGQAPPKKEPYGTPSTPQYVAGPIPPENK